MGLQSAFFTAISGLSAAGRALAEIGNNIANAETVGYKARRISFGDLFGATIGGGGTSTAVTEGRGVSVLGVDTVFTQGSLASTSNALDMAIDGDGFFQLKDAAGNSFYSRDGQFSVDKDGKLVNPSGLFLQGFQANSSGTILGTTGDLVLTTTQEAASATSKVTLSGNLDATVSSATFAISNPSGTSQFSTGVTVYDSLGTAHDLTIYFTKTGDNTWRYNVVASSSEVTVDASAVSGTNALIYTGSLTFTSSGALDTETSVAYYDASSASAGGIDFTGGASANQTITFDFGTSVTTDGGTGLDGFTQFGSSSTVLTLSQDGKANGTLTGTTIGSDGIIVGRFSNGTTRNLGQVALVRFTNPDGLDAVGRNLFIETSDSGTPTTGKPDSGAFGKVVANTLESSNVDLGDELVKMITMQRTFQANSRIITTTNDLLGELVNLSR
ncbi:MAG: flagellar hook protein FlgE [Nitrospirae bacterium]|nr:MAG: flagellar hook protein FlgE [Nitrospirota bacterium]